MKNIIKNLLLWLSFGLWIFIVYAASTITWLGQWPINSWDSIWEGWFNDIENAVVPQGTVDAFYGETCPNGRVKADGSWDEVKVDGTIWSL